MLFRGIRLGNYIGTKQLNANDDAVVQISPESERAAQLKTWYAKLTEIEKKDIYSINKAIDIMLSGDSYHLLSEMMDEVED